MNDVDHTISNPPARLSSCEVCGRNDAKYTCPKCEVKTCSLSCVNIHKKEIECDGVRDRTKFIYVKNFSSLNLRSDYKLLEDCSRFLYGKRRNIEKRYTHIDKHLPPHLSRLKRAAYSRGTVLLLVLEHFTKRRINTTRLVKNIFYWRVEWVFPNATGGAVKLCDARCEESKRLSSLLHKYFDEVTEETESLAYYQAAGMSGVRIFLKAERMKGCAKKFHELDLSASLKENLAGKCIVEFPVIFVILKDHSYDVNIVQSDDEEAVKIDSKQYPKIDSRNSSTAKQFKKYDDLNIKKSPIEEDNGKVSDGNGEYQGGNTYRPPRELATAKFAREEKQKLEKEMVQEMKKKPKNLLFVTGYSSDEDELV